MSVYWLEQIEQDVPIEDNWLSVSELNRLKNLRFAKRRADWRLGRWTAKRALACCLGLSPDVDTFAEIDIRPAPSGSPEVFISRRKQPLHLSISHCSGRGLCAITLSGASVGCDVEAPDVRHDAFLTDYFTTTEQAYVRNAPPAQRWYVLAVLWSAKESALKALRVGLRLDTRLVVVNIPDTDMSDCSWHDVQVSCPNEIFVGFYSKSGNFVRTIVTPPPPQLLTQLRSSIYRAGDSVRSTQRDHETHFVH